MTGTQTGLVAANLRFASVDEPLNVLAKKVG